MEKQLLPILMLLLAASVPSASAQTVWTNASGGSWSVPGNWTPQVVPDAGTNVFLTNNLATSYVVLYDSGNPFNDIRIQDIGTGTNTLRLNAVGFSPAGNITVGPRGVLDLNGYAATAGGGITVSNLGQLVVQGANLTVATNSGYALLGGTTTITNNGTFQAGAAGLGVVSNTGTLFLGEGGSLLSGVVTNTGAFRTTNGTGLVSGFLVNMGGGTLVVSNASASGVSSVLSLTNGLRNQAGMTIGTSGTLNLGGTDRASASVSSLTFTNAVGATITLGGSGGSAGTYSVGMINASTNVVGVLNQGTIQNYASSHYVTGLVNAVVLNDSGGLLTTSTLVNNMTVYAIPTNNGTIKAANVTASVIVQNGDVVNNGVINDLGVFGVSSGSLINYGSVYASYSSCSALSTVNNGTMVFSNGSTWAIPMNGPVTNNGSMAFYCTSPNSSAYGIVSFSNLVNNGTMTSGGKGEAFNNSMTVAVLGNPVTNQSSGSIVVTNGGGLLFSSLLNNGTIVVCTNSVAGRGATIAAAQSPLRATLGTALFSNNGTIILSNGYFAATMLTNAAGATLQGAGTIGQFGISNFVSGSLATTNFVRQVAVKPIVNSGTISPEGILNAGVISNLSGGQIVGYGTIQSIGVSNYYSGETLGVANVDIGARIVNQAGASILGSGGTLVLSNGFQGAYQEGTVGAINGGTLQLGDGTVGFTNGGMISVNNGMVNFGAVLNTNAATFVNGAGNYSGLFTITNKATYVSRASSNYFNAGLLVAPTGSFTVSNGNSLVSGVVTNAGTICVYDGGGTVSNAVVNQNGVMDLDMGSGNLWTLLGGTIVGDAAGATGAVTMTSGTLAVTNGASSAVMDLVKGSLVQTNGTVIADLLYATNGTSSAITLSGGALNVGTLVVSNGSAFVVGNGTLATTNSFLSGYTANGSRFSDGMAVNPNAVVVLGASERLDDSTVMTLQGGALNLGGFSETVGTVLVDGGMVQSAGGGTLSAGAITNLAGGSTFQVSGGSLTLNAPVGGSGSLSKTGAGTLVLSGANTYSGATVIGAGTLQVGAGGTSGTLGTGNVTNNTALVFSRSDSLTVNNLITGSGALTQNGGGILTLTGANTYSGGTTVNVGTLGLGVDNALGTGLVTMDGGGLASSGGARALTNVVNLASGGTFDTAAGNLTLSGVVTNSGNLVKSGANTLILSGANSYSGATVIGAGTLQVGTGGTSGALGTGNVTNNAALVFNRSDNLTIANTITGTGVLTQGGAGTLVLSGANGYGGGTVVKSGTLQIGSDGSLGSAAGAVTLTNGASLQITADVSMARALAVDAGGGQLAIGANTLSNSGALSGSGALTLSGTGILALAGDGSGYSGAVTNLNGATLQLDSANALGSAGLVLGASTTVTNAAATTIGGAITGGSGIVFVKNGAGNLTLAGNSGASFLGNTTVSGGTLGVTGSLGGSAVVVSTGARLEGTGTVGTLANHGTVQPGDAGTIGTLTVNGVYTNASDGTLAIKLGNTGLCDRLVVGGAAVLGGALDLTTTGGYVAKAGDTFTNLVTATGGVSGTFSTSTITPTLEFTISYNPNDVGVRLGAAVTRNYINPGLGLNGGQMELGQALQELSGVTSGDLNAVLNAVDQLGTADSVRQAFNEILPLKMTAMGAMASQGTAVQVGNLLTHLANPLVAGGFASMGKGQNGRKPIQLAFNSPDLQGLLSPDTRKKPSPKWNFFLNGSGTIADQETTVTSPGFNFTSEGTIMGLDYWISEEWMVGGCTGYSQTQADLAGSGGQVTVGTIPVWTFGSWRKQGWYVNGGGGYTCNLYDNERNIRFPGIERTAKSEPSGSQVNGFLEGGHDFKLGSWTVGPVASLQYSKLWIDSFTESGADALNLSVSSQSAESLQSGLGGRVSYEAKVGAVKVVPQIEASWQKEYRNGRRGIEARLAQGSSPFSVQTDEPDRNFGTLTGRLALEFTPEMNVNLSCQTDVGRQNFSIYTFSGTFSLLF